MAELCTNIGNKYDGALLYHHNLPLSASDICWTSMYNWLVEPREIEAPELGKLYENLSV